MDLARIRIRNVCKALHFDCTGTPVKEGDFAVVTTERGTVLGRVVRRVDGVFPSGRKGPYPKIVRPATAEDVEAHRENAKREKEAHAVCLRRIAARGLRMKLVRTEMLLDKSKIIFYFTADGRIDFRELVKDLAHELRARIEMRQIGVRDEARAVGGIGPCGKELCCASFLSDFEPITVKMAKDQNLALNPAKLSGVCGRLMCCLIYEHDAYTRKAACGACAEETGGPGATDAEGDEAAPGGADEEGGAP